MRIDKEWQQRSAFDLADRYVDTHCTLFFFPSVFKFHNKKLKLYKAVFEEVNVLRDKKYKS